MKLGPSDPPALFRPKATFQFVETLRRRVDEANKENQSPSLDDKIPLGISFSSSSESQFTAVQLSSRRDSRKSSLSGNTKEKLEDFDSILASETSFDVLSDFSFVEEDRHSKISTLILTPVPHNAADHSTSTARNTHKREDIAYDERISTIYTNLSSDTSQIGGNKESPDRITPDFEESKLKLPQRGVTSATTWEGEDDPDKLSPVKKSIGVVQTFTYCSQCQKEALTDVLVRMKPMGL
mmetsp:Transcript_13115/g.24539  ORF Transcript_13115/g.24539 Transcript_13115/m.24539 type:complete len:239 (+) Transcript_13115:1873-2589(+)